jgi:three-Cys-motif partner protein
VDSEAEFFCAKHPWSKYKDLILDYYLTPYLAKVARLRKPIAIIDCFAGPGRFDDGESGSPLIIAEQLSKATARGAEVLGIFIEKNQKLFEKLKRNIDLTCIPARLRCGDFHDFLPEIEELAGTHSIFAYLDPLQPTELRFDDLSRVYDQLSAGQSVETLINFLSQGFVRIALGLKGREGDSVLFDMRHPETDRCNQIAGGEYWQTSLIAASLSQSERVDAVANGYAGQLHRWFKWVLHYPIREKYEDKLPKYHLVFGSRHPDAVDLMNRAMVKARRKFVGARFVEGMLFPNQPREEVVDPVEIEQAILNTAACTGRTSWKLLRICATIRNPCLYTDSELNQAVKGAIQSGRLLSSCKGQRVEQDAEVWLA